MSLLVIEDLDGRLIYARAGDGEAVFGSDGEFEFADDSSDWWESDDDAEDEDDLEDEETRANDADIESDAQALLHVLKTATNHDYQNPNGTAAGTSGGDSQPLSASSSQQAIAGPSSSTATGANGTAPVAGPSKPAKAARTLPTTSAESSLEPDEGETTDELGYEEMPYPRLLVGSIAPRGSGTSRARARANAQAKRNNINNNHAHASAAFITINGNRHPPSAVAGLGSSGNTNSTIIPSSGGTSNSTSTNGTVPSTPKMGPPPSPSIPGGGGTGSTLVPEAAAAAAAGAGPSVPPTTPGAGGSGGGAAPPQTPFRRPEMGTFIPSQDKAVHRAIIDGANKAPSPYQRGKGVMTRGLAPKRKYDDSEGRSTRQRIERRANRGRSPMSMSSARFNGGSNGAPGGSGSQLNGGSGSGSGGGPGGGAGGSNGRSMMLSNGIVAAHGSRSSRKKARVVDMDPGISLDELLDMELLSEGGLVQR